MASLDVTTVARVKSVSQHATTVADARIAELIGSVSTYVENTLARHLLFARRTEEYEVRLGQPVVWVRGMPLGNVYSVKYAERRKFTDVTALAEDDYDLHPERGQIELRVPLTGTPGWVQVDYEGGMALTVTDFMADYASIAEAATLDVVNRLGRSGNPEGDVQAFETGVKYHTGQLGTLKTLDAALAQHRRFVL